MQSPKPRRPLRAALYALQLVVCLLTLGPQVFAETTATDQSALAQWRSIPIFGADVRSFAIHPADPDLVLAGTSAGQLYRSDDGGSTWRPAGQPTALAGWVISKLVFDPDRSDRLWAALWGVWGGGSVLVSDDLGATWTPRGDGLPGQVYSLARVPGTAASSGEAAVDPAPAGKLYAGTRTGVWGSDDGGGSWQRLTAAHPELKKVTSLLVDPRDPNAVTAGTWRRAYRSDDGGQTWRGVFEGMALDSEVFSLEPSPDRPEEVWASTCGWVYRSLDSGRSWKKFKEGLAWRRTPSFLVLPGGRLLAGTVGGLYTSENGGASWARRGVERLPVLALAVHPDRPDRVLIGTEGAGVWISDDGGSSLRRSDTGMVNVHVGALAAGGSGVLAAVNHAGPGSGVHRVQGAGETVDAPGQPLPTILSLAVSGGTVLAATEEGLWEQSAGEWRQVAEIGGRVEQVLTSADRAVARTPAGLFERPGAGARFLPVSYRHDPPRSAGLIADALWVGDGREVHRLVDGQNHTVATPSAGALPRASGDRLMLIAKEGLWLADEAADPQWRELDAQVDAAHPTGDSAQPAIVLQGGVASLLTVGGDGGSVLRRPLDPPFPAREITSALVREGWLYLGTSGWGLWATRLDPPGF